MILLNVSFGIYAFLPQGWIFMAFVIFLECLVMTRLLMQKWLDKRIYGVSTLTNIISGLFGIIISMILYGGWYIVVWFPWVSSNQFDLSTPNALQELIIFYLSAFVLTLIIESVINILFLRKHYSVSEILKATLVTNIVSYAIGTLALYSYSFR